MARSTPKPPAALRAIVAAAAALLLAAGLALAQPASAAPAPAAQQAAAAQPAFAACQAADLSITIPAAIEGDPDRGMGNGPGMSFSATRRGTRAACAAGRGSRSGPPLANRSPPRSAT